MLKGELGDVPGIISFVATTATQKTLRRQTARHDVTGNNVAVILHRITCPSDRLIWVNWAEARLRYGSSLMPLLGNSESLTRREPNSATGSKRDGFSASQENTPLKAYNGGDAITRSDCAWTSS